MKNGFFQSISGNKSSSRLIGFVVIAAGLIFAQEVIILGRADIVQASIAAGTLFLTIAGSAMAFLFAQKGQEIKQEKNTEP
jgi:hypothetical protein